MRPCSICTAKDRSTIDLELVSASLSLEKLTRKFGVSKSALARHTVRCLASKLSAAQQRVREKDVREGDALLVQLKALLDRVGGVLDRCERDGSYVLFFAGVREVREIHELMSRVEGRLQSGPQVNIFASVDFQRVIATVVKSLDGYPDAKSHLIDVLSGKLRLPILAAPATTLDDSMLVDETEEDNSR